MFDTLDRTLNSTLPVLVEFWARWCRPSWMIHPVLARIAREYVGRLQVVTLEVGDARRASALYGIFGIPLFVLFADHEELDRFVGAPPIAQLRQWLEPHLVRASVRR